jgi:N-dimethylarginine dimethylaminohydrolase
MSEKRTAVYNSTGKLKRVLLGKPTYHRVLPISDVARDLYESNTKLDKQVRDSQHAELEQVFVDLGIEIRWIDVSPEFGWQASTRDVAFNTPHGIVLARFRYAERKGEEVMARASLEKLGETLLPRQLTRGCVEGGDCFWLDENTLIIGNGNRSTYAGFEDAREILAEYGKRVFVVEFLSKWNHLDVIFQPVADKLAIICEDAIPDYFVGFLDALGWELIRVPAEYAWRCEINMLALGDDKVLSFRGNRINEMLRARGLEVFDPAFDYFCAQGIGPHCSTLELEREPR